MEGDAFFESLQRSMESAEKYNAMRNAEHAKMSADGFSGEVNVGDRIIVRASMIGAGCGHNWEFRELRVDEVATYAVKATILNDILGKDRQFWIGRELITEVLAASPVV